MSESPNFPQESQWGDMGIGPAGSSRRQGNRGRGRGRTRSVRSQRKVTGSRSESGKRKMTTNSGRLGPMLAWKGRPRVRGGRKRGRRSARSRQKPAKKTVEVGKGAILEESIFEEAGDLTRDELDGDDIQRFQVEGAENASSSEQSEFDDENGQATGDEYDDLIVDEFTGGFSGRANNLQEGSDDNVDGDEEDEDDEEGDEPGDMDVEGYINEDSDEERIRDDEEREQNGNRDEVTGSTSTDFSD